MDRDAELQAAAAKLPKRLRQALLKAAAAAAEHAYRRGFQQGHRVAGEPDAPTAEKVSDWRERGSRQEYHTAEGPPGTVYAGRKETAIKRLLTEEMWSVLSALQDREGAS